MYVYIYIYIILDEYVSIVRFYIWALANNPAVQNIRNHYVGDFVHRGHNTLIIGAI